MLLMIDNYNKSGVVVQDQTMAFAHDVRINNFSIRQINPEVRAGKASAVAAGASTRVKMPARSAEGFGSSLSRNRSG